MTAGKDVTHAHGTIKEQYRAEAVTQLTPVLGSEPAAKATLIALGWG
jgi:hypothetical protein